MFGSPVSWPVGWSVGQSDSQLFISHWVSQSASWSVFRSISQLVAYSDICIGQLVLAHLQVNDRSNDVLIVTRKYRKVKKERK